MKMNYIKLVRSASQKSYVTTHIITLKKLLYKEKALCSSFVIPSRILLLLPLYIENLTLNSPFDGYNNLSKSYLWIEIGSF
jgi:hypothetical protein